VTPEPTGSTSERQVPSAALFQGRREIIIVHHGQEYRLRITRADKLILTK
jgi:hemin uptake protein HemP